MNKLKYVYHVAYYYSKEDKTNGTGSITVYRATKLDTEDEIKSLVKFLKNELELDQVVILNFILLNKRGKR